MNNLNRMLRNLETPIAKWLSVLFHPILLPTWLYVSLILCTPSYILQIPAGMEWVLAGFIFVSTGCLPIIIILLMVKLKIIGSIQLNERVERNGPMLVSALFFFMTYYLLDHFGFIPVFGYYLLCVTSISLLTMMVNTTWKISLHTTGHGAMLATYISLAMLVEIPIFLIAFAMVAGGITATARLKLQAHTPAELYSGYALGFVTMMLLFRIIS